MEMDTQTIAMAAGALILIGIILHAACGGSDTAILTLQLHKNQVAWLAAKSEKYCDSGGIGKAIRCIIDYLRETGEDEAKQALSETPKYKSDLEPFVLDNLHEGQKEWLQDHGVKCDEVKVGEDNGPAEFPVSSILIK